MGPRPDTWVTECTGSVGNNLGPSVRRALSAKDEGPAKAEKNFAGFLKTLSIFILVFIALLIAAVLGLCIDFR